jgi:hypothetical protein
MATAGNLITRSQMAADINVITSDRYPRAEWYRLDGTPAHPANNIQGPNGGEFYNGGSCGVYIGYRVNGYGEASFGGAGAIISASTVLSNYRELAKRCTRYQKLNFYTEQVGCQYFYWGNRVIARDVEDGTLNSQIDTISGPSSGALISASAISNFVTALNNKSAESLNIQHECRNALCHCSCHSSCHASRARR